MFHAICLLNSSSEGQLLEDSQNLYNTNDTMKELPLESNNIYYLLYNWFNALIS